MTMASIESEDPSLPPSSPSCDPTAGIPGSKNKTRGKEDNNSSSKDNNFQTKVLFTALIYLTYVCPGLSMMPSSTLLDVAELTHSTTVAVSIGFAVKTLVYCIGSVSFTWLLQRTGRPIGLMIALSGASAAMFCVPLCPTVSWYWGTQAFAGLCNAGIDICCISWLLELWPESGNAFMQGLYFCFYLGTMMSSVLAAPFLSSVIESSPESQAYENKVHANVTNGPSITNGRSVPVDSLTQSQIIIPYFGISIFMMAVVSLHLLTLILLPYENKYERRPSNISIMTMRSLSAFSGAEDEDRVKVITVVTMGSFLLGFLSGAEYMTSSYIATFGVFCDLHLSKETGALMVSLFGGSGALTLATATAIACRVTSRTMLYSGLLVFGTGNLLLAVTVTAGLDLLLWPSVLILGIGAAIFVPTTYAFLSEHVTVTTQMFGCFTFVKSMGRSASSLTVGYFIESKPLVLIATNAVCLTAGFLIMTLFHCKVYQRRHHSSPPSSP